MTRTFSRLLWTIPIKISSGLNKMTLNTYNRLWLHGTSRSMLSWNFLRACRKRKKNNKANKFRNKFLKKTNRLKKESLRKWDSNQLRNRKEKYQTKGSKKIEKKESSLETEASRNKSNQGMYSKNQIKIKRKKLSMPKPKSLNLRTKVAAKKNSSFQESCSKLSEIKAAGIWWRSQWIATDSQESLIHTRWKKSSSCSTKT